MNALDGKSVPSALVHCRLLYLHGGEMVYAAYAHQLVALLRC